MAANTRKGLVGALDALIAKHHLLKHPFYQAWREGKLTREQLALYAEQYYQHVQGFPENLKTLAGRVNGELRRTIEENLSEELDPAGPHPALWRQFARAVRASERALASTHPLPGICALLDTFDELVAHETQARGVASLYAYEAQVPEIAAEKINGLRLYYGIEDPAALSYFVVHQEADVRHRAAWREWLSRQPEEDAIGILAVAERALKALWRALDAVYPQARTVN